MQQSSLYFLIPHHQLYECGANFLGGSIIVLKYGMATDLRKILNFCSGYVKHDGQTIPTFSFLFNDDN
jgi:hypothetical protein